MAAEENFLKNKQKKIKTNKQTEDMYNHLF